MSAQLDDHRVDPGDTRPTISVIVPAYDAEPFLDAALASVAAQSLVPDEVVVVDDASTDGTAAIARRWARRLPIVLVQRPRNEGLGAARKVGIERATGSLIALLDADDYLMPDHLAVLLEAWTRHGGVIAADNIDWFPAQRLGHTRWAQAAPVPPADEQARRILTGNFGCYCSMFSRADYDRAGGFRALRKSEDWDLWIRMVRTGSPIHVAPTPTLIYRKRLDSLSADDGCLSANIGILEELAGQVTDDEKVLVARALRRCHAREEFLAAFDDVAAGAVARARWRWVKAALTDRSLRRDRGNLRSVTLRALACIAAPRWALEQRRERRLDVSRLVG